MAFQDRGPMTLCHTFTWTDQLCSCPWCLWLWGWPLLLTQSLRSGVTIAIKMRNFSLYAYWVDQFLAVGCWWVWGLGWARGNELLKKLSNSEFIQNYNGPIYLKDHLLTLAPEVFNFASWCFNLPFFPKMKLGLNVCFLHTCCKSFAFCLGLQNDCKIAGITFAFGSNLMLQKPCECYCNTLSL